MEASDKTKLIPVNKHHKECIDAIKKAIILSRNNNSFVILPEMLKTASTTMYCLMNVSPIKFFTSYQNCYRGYLNKYNVWFKLPLKVNDYSDMLKK